MDAVQHRGGLSVLRGVAPGALANVDPSVVSDIEGGLTGLQRATTFEKGAAGLSSATTAGFQPSSGQASVATGGLAGPQGTPLQLQIEREKEAAANARAASSASGERGPGITFSGKPDEQGNQINITGGGKTSLKTPEQVRDYAIAHGLAPPVVQPPGVTPPPTAPAAKSGRVPSLPMAKTDTPANAPATGGIQVLSNSTPNVAETANKIRASLNTGGGGLTPGQVAAIKRGMAMNGGQVKIGVAPGGTWHVLDDKNNVVQ
jgi:hypothetical protein